MKGLCVVEDDRRRRVLKGESGVGGGEIESVECSRLFTVQMCVVYCTRRSLQQPTGGKG